MTKRQKKKKKERPTTTTTTDIILCSCNDFLALFLVALQGQPTRRVQSSFNAYSLVVLVFSLSVCIFTHSNIVKSKSGLPFSIYTQQYNTSMFFFNTNHFTLCVITSTTKKRNGILEKKKIQSLIEYNCINPFIYVSYSSIQSFFFFISSRCSLSVIVIIVLQLFIESEGFCFFPIISI